MDEYIRYGVVYENNSTALLVAASAGQLAIVKWLLETGVSSITEKNKDDDTALLLAAEIWAFTNYTILTECISWFNEGKR